MPPLSNTSPTRCPNFSQVYTSPIVASQWCSADGDAAEERSGGVRILEHGCVANIEDLDPSLRDSAVVLGGGWLPSPVPGSEDHQDGEAEFGEPIGHGLFPQERQRRLVGRGEAAIGHVAD